MDKPIQRIARMVENAERHADDLAKDRIRATEYYRGEMKDTPAEKNRSKVTTRDLRATVKKALPSIARTILNADQVVEYMPFGPGDEDYAEQATDYVNHIVLPESDGKAAIYDAIHDALVLRNGILKWWHEEKEVTRVSRHTGLTDDALAVLVGDDEVEVLEHTASEEEINGEPVTLHDVRVRRTETRSCIKAAAVPRERFLIHSDAVSLQDALLVGEKTEVTRSDLVAMGYDRKLIDELPLSDEDDVEENTRRDFVAEGTEEDHSNEMVDYYDIYVRVDMDGDGIAELRHMCFAGGLGEKNLLVDDEADEPQFCDLAIMRQPHQWEGVSLADDLMDIQQIKTMLLRQTLDNLYWQNNPQPWYQEGTITNLETLYSPEFGKPIRVREGTDVRGAMGYNQVPFVAKESFGMLEYLDSEAQDRTGVTDASGGLAPEALQNMTATASAILEQGGIAQIEMMVRNIADSLRVFFRGILRLVVKHQDVPRTVRLRDEWVEIDPRDWNAEMDCTVNTGLGAGTRERDMLVMQQIMLLQEKMLAGFGPDNPFVKPENVHAALTRLVESAGLKNPALYFTEPDPQEVEQKLEAMRNQPDPEMVKAQAAQQLAQAKLQGQAELEKLKVQAAQMKEKAQMDADLMVKQAEIEAEGRRQADKLTADAAIDAQRGELKREELRQQREIAFAKMQQDRELEVMKLRAAHGEIFDTSELEPVMQALQGLVAVVQNMAEAASRPKRVIRDENGDVVGVEVVAPERLN